MAYLNFQNCTRQEYEDVLYSQDARNKIKILFNNVELQNADLYCEKFTVKSRIIPNGAKQFSLNNFISKEAELILHDVDLDTIQNQVSISIGTLVNNVYEYVPIGIFNIQDQPTNDKDKTTIKLRDNSVLFDFYYNAQPLIEENGGSATKLQILQDICTQANVTCNITSFIGYLDEIGIYDNTITARQYIANIAEQAGKIATINRSGELIFVDLNNLTTWEIPLNIVEKYENGTTYKIGKVVYEDGIVRYETEDSNDDTLFLDGSNNYINNDLVMGQSSSNDNTHELNNTSDENVIKFNLEGKTTQETVPGYLGKNLLYIGNIGNTLGLTITKVNNSRIAINGTVGATGVIPIQLLYGPALENTNYTLSFNISGQASGSFGIDLPQSSQFRDISITTNYLSKTSNKETGRTFSVLNLGVTKNMVFTSVIISMQLEEGSSATSFEEATYTLPIPNVNEPRDLISLGNYNLFDKSSITLGKRIDGSGSLYNDNNYAVSDWIKVTPNSIYIYNRYQAGGGSAAIAYYDSNKAFISRKMPIIAYSFLNDYLTTPNNAEYVRITDLKTVINDIVFSQSINKTEYIQYSKYGIQINTSGKNLFDLSNSTWTGSGSGNMQKIENGIQFNSIAASGLQYAYNNNKNYPAGTYSYSHIGSSNHSRLYIRIRKKDNSGWMNSSDTSITSMTYNNVYSGWFYSPNTQNLQMTFTIPECLYWNIGIGYDSGVTTPATITNLQLEKGSTTTTYESYNENSNLYLLTQPLRSINNVKDRLYIENNKFYVERNIGYIASYDGESITTDYMSTTGGLDTGASVQYVLATPNTEEITSATIPATIENKTNVNIPLNMLTNSYIKYYEKDTKLEAILNETNQFNIDSLKTGKILGNPAIDGYDLIEITDGDKTLTTLATSDLTYNGVLINSFDTQIGEEAKEQNVFINGEETFKKWAKTQIDNVEGTLTLQAGEINEANGRINETTLQISSQGALLDVIANNSNIDIAYDNDGNPLSGEVTEVTTKTGFTFNAEGMSIKKDDFEILQTPTGAYYKEGNNIVGQYTKDGSKQKDLQLFGVYYYGMKNKDDTPMFVAQLYNDENNEECFGHFYNRGD